VSVYRRGVLLATASAIAFGVTAPFVQRAGAGAGAFATAALLYGGAALFTVPWLRRRQGAQLTRRDLPRLAFVAVAGAALAPACLAWGLAATSGVTASLLLNTEAVFTFLLAVLIYREHVGRRAALALAVMTAGGALLVLGGGGTLRLSPGALAIAAASLLWAVDNTLTRALADRDVAQVIVGKAALGASLSTVAALAIGDRWPDLAGSAAILACGAGGYGLSLRLYLAAQRTLGAGRTGSVFAAAPFVGVLVAVLLGERPTVVMALSGLLLAAGLVLHMSERHRHRHAHRAVGHDHLHRHDDGHHTHQHDPQFEGEHSHPHEHEPVEHEHEHTPDLHHQHDH
jgi:drug/metabolite transporter (DMT)-like permease